MYIWAFDLSISSAGVSIFMTEGTPMISFSIKTNAKEGYGKRLRTIYKEINKFSANYPCKEVVVESGFTRFNRATQVLYRVHGLIEFMFSEAEYFSYAPTSVKKTITGNGRATKEEVCEKILSLYKNIKFKNDDESDAFAVGICHFIKNKTISEIL